MVHYPPILREILLQFIFGLKLTRLMQSGGNLAPAGAAQDPKAEEARGRPEGQQGRAGRPREIQKETSLDIALPCSVENGQKRSQPRKNRATERRSRTRLTGHSMDGQHYLSTTGTATAVAGAGL